MRLLRLVPDNTKIKFMRGRFASVIVSAVLSTISVVLFFYPGLNLGVDLRGGTSAELRTPMPMPPDSIRHALEPLGFGDVRAALAFLAVLVYIWFRFDWQFGVGVVATLILDVTKTVGFFAVTRLEFDLNAVGALLILIGYSVTDKVVVYDRIRENLRKYFTMPLRELIDLSINQTLSRTVATSLTVLLSILPLALIGGEVLRGFALAIIFGIVVGMSSSIFIASPILLFLGQKRLRANLARGARTTQSESDRRMRVRGG